MTTLHDCVCELARQKAAKGNSTVVFYRGEMKLRYASDAPVGTLDVIINEDWDRWVAYPTGLVIETPRVQWVWNFNGHQYLSGTAEQAWRFAERLGIDPAVVDAVPADALHGLHVFSQGVIYSSRPFPVWTR